MQGEQIVIVSAIDDPHTDEMISLLLVMVHEAIRLNTEDIPLNITMSLSFDNDVGMSNGSIVIQTNGRVIDVEAIRSIWWRRPGEFGLPTMLTEQEHVFAQDE